MIEALQKEHLDAEVLIHDSDYGDYECTRVNAAVMRKNRRESAWASPWNECTPRHPKAQSVVVLA